jgi:hypothetical protein
MLLVGKLLIRNGRLIENDFGAVVERAAISRWDAPPRGRREKTTVDRRLRRREETKIRHSGGQPQVQVIERLEPADPDPRCTRG